MHVQAKLSAFFGAGSGLISLDNVQCSGGEETLGECPKLDWNQHNCKHTEDAGVVCQPGKAFHGLSSSLLPPFFFSLNNFTVMCVCVRVWCVCEIHSLQDLCSLPPLSVEMIWKHKTVFFKLYLELMSAISHCLSAVTV